MKRILLLFLTGALAGACTDRDYDLGKIDTDDIAIGDGTSVFRIPLATVRVRMADISDSGTDIQAIFSEADTWLPSELDGGAADIQRVMHEPAYLDELLARLTAEMRISDMKLRAVTDLVWSKYKDIFQSMIPGLSGDETADGFYDVFKEAFRNDAALRGLLIDKVDDLARVYLTKLRVEELRYEIGHIDLGSEVVDMLAESLDSEAKPGEPNTLCLYGEIDNRLPVSMILRPELTPTAVTCTIDTEAAATNCIDETLLSGDDLRQIVDGMVLVIPVTLDKYYPGIGFDDGLEEQIVITLRLVKRGGLSLNI